MTLKKIFILANQHSRDNSAEGLKVASNLLSKHLDTKVVLTKNIEHAKSITSNIGQNPDNLVVACGGDGTINTIVNALPPQGVLGIIPAGTANVISKELGIPISYKEAAKTLLTTAINKLDIGVINGRKFIFVAGIGFDAHVAKQVSPFLKKKIGKFAYHIAALQSFIKYKPPTLTVLVDEEPISLGQFGIIANMRRYGGDFFFAKNARYDDGLLNIMLLKSFTLHTMLKVLTYAKRCQAIPNKFVTQISAKNITIKSNREVLYQLDGEVINEAKTFNIKILPKHLKIVMP